MGISLHKVPDNSFEVRVGVIHSGYGDDYEVGFVITEVDNDTVEIRLVSNHITTEMRRELVEKLRGLGYKKALWERRKDGKIIYKEYIL